MKKYYKYLKYPLEIFLFLLVFVALLYFRNVIFHTNVTHPIDLAMSFIEDKTDVQIPVYVSKSNNLYSNERLNEPVVAEVEVVEVSESLTVDSEIVQEPAYELVVAESDSPEVVKPELVENAVTEDEAASEDVLLDTAETVETEITSNTNDSNQHVVEEDDQSLYDNKIISEITRTLEVINKKVDDLYNAQDVLFMSQNNAPVTETSDNNAIVNSKAVDAETTQDEVSIDSVQSTEKMKTLARQSFWNGNSFLSEKFYLGLMKYEDNDPDIYGELGNVYYAQGKWKQAGEAYYQAAIRLLDLKQNQQVDYLLRVIQGLDAESAEKLKQKMSG